MYLHSTPATPRAGEGQQQLTPHYYDLIFVDVFDGQDRTPAPFFDPNGSFLPALRSILHPSHGTMAVRGVQCSAVRCRAVGPALAPSFNTMARPAHSCT